MAGVVAREQVSFEALSIPKHCPVEIANTTQKYDEAIALGCHTILVGNGKAWKKRFPVKVFGEHPPNGQQFDEIVGHALYLGSTAENEIWMWLKGVCNEFASSKPSKETLQLCEQVRLLSSAMLYFKSWHDYTNLVAGASGSGPHSGRQDQVRVQKTSEFMYSMCALYSEIRKDPSRFRNLLRWSRAPTQESDPDALQVLCVFLAGLYVHIQRKLDRPVLLQTAAFGSMAGRVDSFFGRHGDELKKFHIPASEETLSDIIGLIELGLSHCNGVWKGSPTQSGPVLWSPNSTRKRQRGLKAEVFHPRSLAGSHMGLFWVKSLRGEHVEALGHFSWVLASAQTNSLVEAVGLLYKDSSSLDMVLHCLKGAEELGHFLVLCQYAMYSHDRYTRAIRLCSGRRVDVSILPYIWEMPFLELLLVNAKELEDEALYDEVVSVVDLFSYGCCFAGCDGPPMLSYVVF